MQPVTHRPGQPGVVTVWQEGQPTQLELPWGLRPVEPYGKPVSLLRWEGRAITRPGLLVVDSFALRIDGKDKYRVRIPGHNQFCIACVWQPAGRDWPAAYAALTTEAYPDIAPYKDRHMAVVREDDWIAWLRQERSIDELLRPFPAGSFKVTGPRLRIPQVQPHPPADRDLFGAR
jgi:putative SOS response-associated peptidase YedK